MNTGSPDTRPTNSHSYWCKTFDWGVRGGRHTPEAKLNRARIVITVDIPVAQWLMCIQLSAAKLYCMHDAILNGGALTSGGQFNCISAHSRVDKGVMQLGARKATCSQERTHKQRRNAFSLNMPVHPARTVAEQRAHRIESCPPANHNSTTASVSAAFLQPAATWSPT